MESCCTSVDPEMFWFWWIIYLNFAKLILKVWIGRDQVLSWKYTVTVTQIGLVAMLPAKAQLHSWFFFVEIWFSMHVVHKQVLLYHRVKLHYLPGRQQLEMRCKCQTFWDFLLEKRNWRIVRGLRWHCTQILLVQKQHGSGEDQVDSSILILVCQAPADVEKTVYQVTESSNYI